MAKAKKAAAPNKSVPKKTAVKKSGKPSSLDSKTNIKKTAAQKEIVPARKAPAPAKKSSKMQNTTKDKQQTASSEAQKSSGTQSQQQTNGTQAQQQTSGSQQSSQEQANSKNRITERNQSRKKKGSPEHTSKEGPLYKFFLDGLKDIYYAEQQILSGLSKMQKATTTNELEEAFEDHYLVTKKQISRLEKVFSILDERAEAKKCEAILGILKEGESVIEDTEEGTMTRDAALIIAAQKVEHYEIASYGGLVALAETMGLQQVADLLDQTLQEEADCDTDLTDIAESCINFEAEEEESVEMEETETAEA